MDSTLNRYDQNLNSARIDLKNVTQGLILVESVEIIGLFDI